MAIPREPPCIITAFEGSGECRNAMGVLSLSRHAYARHLHLMDRLLAISGGEDRDIECVVIGGPGVELFQEDAYGPEDGVLGRISADLLAPKRGRSPKAHMANPDSLPLIGRLQVPIAGEFSAEIFPREVRVHHQMKIRSWPIRRSLYLEAVLWYCEPDDIHRRFMQLVYDDPLAALRVLHSGVSVPGAHEPPRILSRETDPAELALLLLEHPSPAVRERAALHLPRPSKTQTAPPPGRSLVF